MKVKIRGLVFAGFAAAVFAQSASAEITDSDKTVTSKTYVDTNFQNLTQKDPTTGEYPNDVTSISDSSTNVQYPTSRNVYKFVKQELQEAGATGNMTGNLEKHTQKVAVFEDGYNGNATNPTDTDLEHLDHWELIVPDGRVAEAASDITAAGAAGATTTVQTNLTTAKAVYDFVTGGDGTGYQRKLTAAEKDPSLGVYNADGTSVWRAARGGTYVTMDTSGTGAITFDVPSNKIATIGADNPNTQEVEVSEITADSTKLTTGKAVYEFVVGDPDDPNSGFQPKATATANGVSTGTNPTAQVGVRTGTGSEQDPYVSTWYGLAAGQDGSNLNSSIDDTAYARVYRDDGAGSNTAGVYVDLDHTRISVASTYTGTGYKHGGIVNISNYFSEDGMALATAGAVKEYVESVLPETTLPPESEMPSVCKTADGNHVCALVAYYDAGVGGVKYEWTVMAPTGN